jgi:DNA primase
MAEKEDSFFLPLLPYMKENEELKTLILHFDRDSAGIRAGEKLKKLLDEEYEVREWREEKEEC